VTVNEVATTAANTITLDNAGFGDDTITTINVNFLVAQTQFDFVIDSGGAEITTNLSGAVAVDLVTTNLDGELNASAMTGALTAAAHADLLTITGGSGDDTITAITNEEFVLVGGDGDDTLVTAALMQSGTFSGFEILDIANGDDFLASQLSGYTAVVSTIGGSIELLDADDIDVAVIDMSGLTAETATDDIDINLALIDGAVLLAGQGFTYTGWNGADNVDGSANADTLSGGAGADNLDGAAGADTITGGEGADTITGGTGADIIILTETTSAADDVVIGTADGSAVGVAGGTFSGFDVVTGFVSGTDDVDVTINGGGAADTYLTQNAAATVANDLADGEHTDVDAVLAFLNDAANGLAGAAGDIDVIAITFSDYTAIYSVTSAAADTTISAGEIRLLATVDDVLAAGDLI
jgi:Ca2+-binding RTX toxin-like protein